jgi:putative endonuclease
LSRTQLIGRQGERAAADYLTRRGYRLISHNVRTPYGEIDLIVQKDDLTIFVEVKARASSSLGPPELSVTPRKQAHMLACAEYYCQQHQLDHWRIDVIAVQRIGARKQIVHFENALS